MIKVRVKNRIITCKKELVEDNVDTFSLVFDFDSMWEGYTKRITFFNDGIEEHSSNPIEIPLEDSCIIPWEVIQSPGNLYLSIKGTKQDTNEVILTQLMNNPIKVNIAGLSGGVVPAEPTPDMVTLIMSTAQEAKDIAQSVKDDADAGKFIGPPGPKGDKGDPGTPGRDGAPGKDATINGKNAVNILAGDNINIDESGENIKISASNQKQIATNENEITDITEIVIDDVDNPLVIDNEVTNASTGIASSKAVYNFVQETENNMIKAPTVQGTAGQILGLDENLLPIWLDKENKKYIKLIDDLTIDNDITRIFSYTQFKDGSPLDNLSEIMIFTSAVKTDTVRKLGITFNDEYTSSAYQWNIFDWQYGFSETQSSGFFYCNLKNGINLSGGKQNSSSYTYYDMHIQNRIFTYEKGIEKLTFGLGWGHFLSGSNFKIYAR